MVKSHVPAGFEYFSKEGVFLPSPQLDQVG